MNSLSRSKTRSFRIEETIIKQLEALAKERGQSANALVASILGEYVKVGAWTSAIPVVMLRKELLVALLSSLSDERVSEIGRKLGSEVTRTSVRFMYRDITTKTFLDILGAQSSYMRWGSYSTDLKDNVLEVYIRHEIGRKWSLFLEAYVGQEGSNILEANVQSSAAEGMVSFKFTPKTNSY